MAATGTPLPLDACLDPSLLQSLLQRELARRHGPGRVDHLRISRVRRNTSRRRNPHPMTFCVDMDWCTDGEAPKAWLLYGKVFRDGASARAQVAGSPLHLPELDLLFWPWPQDPGLPQLSTLLQPGCANAWWDGCASQVQLLHYTPESRASLRYADARDPAQPQHLFAKTFAGEQGAAIHRRFVHFWEQSRLRPDAPLVAEPLGYDAATHTVWQAEVRGMPLVQVIAHGTSAAWVSQVAAAMAVVHRAPVVLADGQRRGLDHWLAELPRRVSKVTRAAPILATTVDAAVAQLIQASQALPGFEPTLIHGDCHPDQFMMADRRVVVFDFDEFALGDPMEDLAAFLVKLDPVARRRWGEALARAYEEWAPALFDGQRLRWYEALQHVLQACRAFTFQVPGWRESMARQLQLATVLTRTLASAEGTP
jgi:hypothetical protein